MSKKKKPLNQERRIKEDLRFNPKAKSDLTLAMYENTRSSDMLSRRDKIRGARKRKGRAKNYLNNELKNFLD